jgi:hypothetical protein
MIKILHSFKGRNHNSDTDNIENQYRENNKARVFHKKQLKDGYNARHDFFFLEIIKSGEKSKY